MEAAPDRLSVAVDARCEIQAEVRRDERSACWRLACKDRAARELGCDLTAMHQIASIDVAPDRRHLSVVSVGEGHPLLELVPLRPLLKKGSYDADCTINPYPGTLVSGAWQGSDYVLETDVDLTVESVEARVEQMTDGSYRWRIEPRRCRPQRMPDAAADSLSPD